MTTHLSSALAQADNARQYTTIDQPLPHFYIVRPDKTFVPLIAADEIDPMWRIKGIPATISADVIQQWNLARCGDELDRQQHKFQIEQLYVEGSDDECFESSCNTGTSPASSMFSGNHGNGQYASQGFTDKHLNGGRTLHRTPVSAQQTQETIDRMVKENDWAKNNDHSRTKDAFTPGVFGKKKYCTYWIRTGNCDYIQEGCRYLHVIPDEETRLRIGIRDMPRWAKEDLPTPQYGPDRQYHQRSSLNQDWRNSAPASAQAELSAAPPVPNSQSRFSSPAVHTPPTSNGTQNHQSPASFLDSATPISQPQLHHHAAVMTQQNHFARPPNNRSLNPFKSDKSAASESLQRQLRAATAASQAGSSNTLGQSVPDGSAPFSSSTQPPISRPAPNTNGAIEKHSGQTSEQRKNEVRTLDSPSRFSVFGEAQSLSSKPSSPIQFPNINHFPEMTRHNKAPTDARVYAGSTSTSVLPRANPARAGAVNHRHRRDVNAVGKDNSNGHTNGNGTTVGTGFAKDHGNNTGNAKINSKRDRSTSSHKDGQTNGTNRGPIYYHTPPGSGETAHLRRFVGPGSPVYVVNAEETEIEKPVKQPIKTNGHRNAGHKIKGRGKNTYNLIDIK